MLQLKILKKHSGFVWCILLVVLFSLNPALKAQEIITIDSPQFDFSMGKGKSLLVFEDTSGVLTLNDIIENPPFNNQLTGPNNLTGFYWIKLSLLNTTNNDLEVVVTGFRTINSKLFQVLTNGEVFTAPYGAFQKKKGLNQGDSRAHVSFALKAGAPQDIYFRVHGRAFSANFMDSKTFRNKQLRAQVQDLLFFGACLILVIYSLIQFGVYRYMPYLWLAMFALGMGMYAFSVQGYFVDWILPNSPATALNFTMPWSQFGHLGMLFLAISFLELKAKFPFWYKVFIGLITLTLLRTVAGVVLTSVYQDYALMTDMSIKLLMIDITLFHVMLFALWKKVERSRKVFLVGLIVFGATLVIASFTWKYIFDSKSVVLLYTSSLGTLAQVLIFSIAIGIRMRQHEIEKNMALSQLNVVLKEQNKRVENEVVERTQEIEDQKVVLQERNERIETLFREIHHRVKNNLQLISSLLNMQQEWSGTKDSAKAIEESRSRVVAMSMIHQFLYRTDDIATIDFKDYVTELVKKIDGIQTNRVSYKLMVDFENHPNFDLDTSISLGLILNELLTNSYKHVVVENNQLELMLKLHSRKDGMFNLTYQDNGASLPDTLEEMTKKGFGLRLASRLATQLHGKLDYEYDCGNRFTIVFADEAMRITLID
tara:strand:+ start:1256 stop:3217 length:1962 start_codon:yes stop_codon:yes gene_type:complete